MISETGLINLIAGVIRITAQDIKWGSGVVYCECVNCLKEVDEKDIKLMICSKCSTPLVYSNDYAEQFIGSEIFEEWSSVFSNDVERVRYLVRHNKVALRKDYE